MKLAYIGHSILRTKTQPVKEVDQHILEVVSNLTEEVLNRSGLGLAAPQIGVSLAIFVARFPEGSTKEELVPGEPKVFINPKILSVSKESVEEEEGCLSVPGIFAQVSRPCSLVLEYQDISLTTHTEEFSEWSARVIMHENDHLNGVLFVDRLSNHVKKKLQKAINDVKRKLGAEKNL